MEMHDEHEEGEVGNEEEQIFLEIVTSKANALKCLFKFIVKNLISGTLLITERGIYLQESREDASVLIEFVLWRQKFVKFRIPKFENPDSVIQLGFSAKTLASHLDSAKMKDTCRIFIKSTDVSCLYVQLTNNGGKNSLKYLSLQAPTINSTISPSYEDHKPNALVKALNYKQVISEMWKISKSHVEIQGQDFGIKISSASSQMGGVIEFWGEWDPRAPVLYRALIPTARLKSITEMTSATEYILFYLPPQITSPLKLKCDVKNIGVVSIYLQGIME